MELIARLRTAVCDPSARRGTGTGRPACCCRCIGMRPDGVGAGPATILKMRTTMASLWRLADTVGMRIYGVLCGIGLAVGWCAGLLYIWHWCWERFGVVGLLLGWLPGVFVAMFTGALLALLWPAAILGAIVFLA